MCEQFIRIEWLDDIVIGPGLHRSTDVCGSGLRGHQDQGEVPQSRVGADTPNDFIAHQTRHYESGENEVEVLPLEPLQPSLAVSCNADIREPASMQIHFDESSNVQVVLDDENPLGSDLTARLVIDRFGRIG